MPVQRTKALKRDDSCNQIVWDSNADLNPASDISFSLAPNYALSDTPPPLVDRPSPEFILFPPPTDFSPSSTTTKRTPHSKKKPSNHIPRPPNAFILFRSSFIKSQHVTTEVETNHSTLSKIIGLTWQNLPEDERQIWHAKAKDALEDHKRKFPKYAFRPVQTKAKASSTNAGGGIGGGGGLGSGGGTEKRRVREVEPKDIKRCAKIAELLVEGKKGASLKAAIAEFDKYHVPEIVTRFETPITAKAFRRSSSAPVPGVDAEEEQQGTKAMFVSENPTGKKLAAKGKKARASSTQPAVPALVAPAPAPLVAPIAPVVYQPQPYALKQENSFNFDDFNFTSTLPSPALECDPFFLPSTTTPSPLDYSACSPLALSIDTQSYHDWASSSSASSPTSPLPATPSDIHALSPAPSFAHFDLVAPFSGQELLSQEFLLDASAVGIQQNMCAQGMYAPYQHQHQQHEQQLVGEFDFSSYMGMGMQYAM